MADPLLGRTQFIAEWDADIDELWLMGTLPGPAGSIELALHGFTIVLDAADPEIVNSVRVDNASALVDPPSGSGGNNSANARELFDRLIGEDLASQVLSVVGEANPTRTRMGTGPSAGRRRPGGLNPVMARLATAMSTAGSPGLLPEERALAQLEALVLIHRLQLKEHFSNFADLIAESASMLTKTTERWSPVMSSVWPDDRSARRLAADICEEASGLIATRALSSELAALAVRWQTPAFDIERNLGLVDHAMLSDQSLSLSEPQIGGWIDATVTLSSLPNLVGGPAPMISRTTNDEYEVRLPGWAGRADGWWVRAFRSEEGNGATNSDIALAIVPMVIDDDDAVAVFLVTEHDASALVIDIVDDPGEPRASQQIAAFKAAVAIGKRAARLERLDRRNEAVHAWERSSELHFSAGDAWRGKNAFAIARDQAASSLGGRTLRVAPVVADLLGPDA